ncbi:MAG: hypothetical protein WEE89_20745 [Gemmatimonadota bacterium]
MEAARRTRMQATALLAVIFVAGGMVGFAVNTVAREPQTTVQPGSGDRPPRQNDDRSRRPGGMMLDQFILDSLNLSVEQRGRIDQILSKRDAEIKNIFDPVRARADTIMRLARKELHTQLTVEQRNQLDQIIKVRHERWKAQREQRDRNRSSDGKPRTDSAKK